MADMIELARQYGSYGYRRVAALLRDAGWQVSDGRVERLWKREGLKVPLKQPKRSRLWSVAQSDWSRLIVSARSLAYHSYLTSFSPKLVNLSNCIGYLFRSSIQGIV